MKKERNLRIANNLKIYREKAGLTQKEVAERLGPHSITLISRWENGDVLPNLASAFKLSRLYKTPLDMLFVKLIACL
jgi:transcriptional regulator with XRE-family HTH domain